MDGSKEPPSLIWGEGGGCTNGWKARRGSGSSSTLTYRPPPNQERGGTGKSRRDPDPLRPLNPNPNPTQGDSIIVASEQGAVAALSASAPDGRIRWRHVLPTAAVDLVVDEGAGLVLALSRCVVSCFIHAGLVMDGRSPPLAFSKAPRTPHPLCELTNSHKHRRT